MSVVGGGDTLQSIASTVWGDASLWYLIADANGLNGNEDLTAGLRLSIP
ncbi:MAG: LysM peptidoglycan-binding domain-containing protein, partial [Planctomycetes bacterium]|nr:LysM peptidoglycan-binding domain-containing protein [Planctomycetota bacterium]